MIEYVTETFWGQPVEAYHLQATPDAAATASMQALQQRIDNLCPDLFYLQPAEALHLTMISPIGVNETLPRPKAEIWAEHAVAWSAAVRALCAGMQPLEFCFSSLQLLNRAVVVTDLSTGNLTPFRARLAQATRLPERVPWVPSIAHMSLARYRRIPQPEEVVLCATLPPFKISFRCQTLRLVREMVYPCIGFEVLETLALTG